MKINIDELKSLREQGYSIGEIGKMYGVTKQAIWMKLKLEGIEEKRKMIPFIIYDNIKWVLYKDGYYRHSKLKLHRYVYEKEHGAIPKGFVIHHKDGDTSNNNIANLICITPQAHSNHHVKQEWDNQWKDRRIDKLAQTWKQNTKIKQEVEPAVHRTIRVPLILDSIVVKQVKHRGDYTRIIIQALKKFLGVK